MTNRAIRATVALYQILGGVSGIWVLLASGQYEARGSIPIRFVMALVLAGYGFLLAVSGILLGLGHPLGARLSWYAQVCQVPRIATRALTYVIVAPACVTVFANSQGGIGLLANAAAELRLSFGTTPEIASVGVNLLAVFLAYIVKYRLAPAASLGDAKSVAA